MIAAKALTVAKAFGLLVKSHAKLDVILGLDPRIHGRA